MRMNDGRVVPNFITQALKNEPITVYGDGTQTRSFCYIDDLIEGIFKTEIIENIDGKVFNLGNTKEHKILDFAHIRKSLTNSKSLIIFKSLPQDDPTRRCPDIYLVKERLHWEPKIGLEEGLGKVIEYFKKKLG